MWRLWQGIGGVSIRAMLGVVLMMALGFFSSVTAQAYGNQDCKQYGGQYDCVSAVAILSPPSGGPGG